MNNSVTNSRHTNLPLFIIGNCEALVAAVPIIAGVQIFKQKKQIFLKIVLKFIQFTGNTFSVSILKPTFPNIT